MKSTAVLLAVAERKGGVPVRNLLRGPALTPVFRSKKKATQYAQRIANETNHLMIVEGQRRTWKVKDGGELPEPPDLEGSE